MEKEESDLKTVFKIEIDVAEEPPQAWHTSDSHSQAAPTAGIEAPGVDPDVLNSIKVKVEPEDVPETTSENHPDGLRERPPCPHKLSKAEKSKMKSQAFRDKRKADPQLYGEFKIMDAQRVREYRRQPITEEEKARRKEQSRLRMAKSRAKKKATKQERAPLSASSAKPTRTRSKERKDAGATRAQRAKWAEYQRKRREKWTPEQWQRYREEALKAYYARKNQQDADVEDKDLPVFFMPALQSSSSTDAPGTSDGVAEEEEEEGTGEECATTSCPAPQLDSEEDPSSSVSIAEEEDDATGNNTSTMMPDGPTPPICTIARQGTSPRAKMAQYFYVAYPTPQSRIEQETKKSVSSSPKIKYSCNDCDASFTSPAELSHHMQTHAKKGPFTCCGTSFSYDGILAHLKTHTVEKTYTCQQCKATFSSSDSLATHMRRHTGEKPFVCKECSSRFAAYSTLKAHARKHHGKKSYTCAECSATFCDAKSLSAHASSKHPEKKPFTCETCGAGFSVLKSLNGHMRMHAGEKSLACEECDATFKSSEALAAHKKDEHAGAKPSYACGDCKAAFSKSEDLTTHQGSHSKESQ